MIEKQIRFASMPKCASRSLKAAGVLGEDGRFHQPITSFPGWGQCEWHIVTRDRDSWLKSWWEECKRHVEEMAEMLAACRNRSGLQFSDFDSDMEALRDPRSLSALPARLFVNAWVPDDAEARYAECLAKGGDLYSFCREVITAGVVCKEVPIETLDEFLLTNGLTAHHMNERERDARC